MARKAFLVEDNAAIRANLSETLRELANTEVVDHAARALDASIWLAHRPNDWDVAVVDLFLAEGSGLSVLAGCRVRKSTQRVVVLSNYVTRAMRERCFAFGADAVFDKATEIDSLVDYCLTL